MTVKAELSQKTFPREAFPHIQAAWRWKVLAACHIAALLLLLSWLPFSPLRGAWDALDNTAFFLMNGSVSEAGWWQSAAGFANTKLFDKISTIVLVLMLLAFIFFGRQGNLAWRGSGVVFLGLYMLVFVFFRRKLGIGEYGRTSPSMDLTPFYNLDDLLPAWNVKVAAPSCFPSDHANASLLFVVLFWALAGKRWGIAALLLSPVFIFPRMFSGAHWLTDTLIGGVVFTLLVGSWALATPLFYRATSLLYIPAAWKLQILLKIKTRIFRK